MRMNFKNISVVLLLFTGIGVYYFYESANNTKGLIINHMFVLNVNQANTFYFVVGCLCILVLALSGLAIYLQKQQYKIKKEFNKKTVESNEKEQENSAKGFKTEIELLKKLIHSCEVYSVKKGYSSKDTSELIDGRCKHFFDILVPLASVSPYLFTLLVTERPSLAEYLKESIDNYIKNQPEESKIEEDFIKTRNQLLHINKDNNFEMGEFGCVYVMLDQYGFSPELLRVIQKIDPSMMKYINYLYYSRLNSWRMVDDFPTNSAER